MTSFVLICSFVRGFLDEEASWTKVQVGRKQVSKSESVAKSSIKQRTEEGMERTELIHSQGLRNKLGVRGVTRGATLGLCVANMVGGGLAYTFGKREDEEE